MQQLETNAKEMDKMCEELQHVEERMEHEYEDFSQTLNSKRRQQQEDNAKDVLKNAKSLDEARKVAADKEAAAAALAAAQASEPKKVLNTIMNKLNTKLPNLPIPAAIVTAATAAVAAPSAPVGVSMSVTIDPNEIKKQTQQQQQISPLKSLNQVRLNDENEDELNRFLEGASQPAAKTAAESHQTTSKVAQELNDDDDDCDDSSANNPMVAAFQETLDSCDEASSVKSRKSSSSMSKSKKAPVKAIVDLRFHIDENENQHFFYRICIN